MYYFQHPGKHHTLKLSMNGMVKWYSWVLWTAYMLDIWRCMLTPGHRHTSASQSCSEANTVWWVRSYGRRSDCRYTWFPYAMCFFSSSSFQEIDADEDPVVSFASMRMTFWLSETIPDFLATVMAVWRLSPRRKEEYPKMGLKRQNQFMQSLENYV